MNGLLYSKCLHIPLKKVKTKILVVEDEAITSRDIRDTLKDLGCDIPTIVSTGERAIKKAEQMKLLLIS